jgi:hypothetical protein
VSDGVGSRECAELRAWESALQLMMMIDLTTTTETHQFHQT